MRRRASRRTIPGCRWSVDSVCVFSGLLSCRRRFDRGGEKKNCGRGAQLFRTKPSLSHGVSAVRNRLSLGVAFVGRCVQHAHAQKMHSARLRNFGSRDGDKDRFFSFELQPRSEVFARRSKLVLKHELCEAAQRFLRQISKSQQNHRQMKSAQTTT